MKKNVLVALSFWLSLVCYSQRVITPDGRVLHLSNTAKMAMSEDAIPYDHDCKEYKCKPVECPKVNAPAKCGPGAFNLKAECVDCDLVVWFDKDFKLLYKGNPYVTPLIDKTDYLYVACINTKGCCSVMAKVNLTINQFPTCNIKGPGEVCEGDSVSLSADCDGDTFKWIYPNGAVVLGPVAANLTIAGVYKLIVTNKYGCSKECTKELKINPRPQANNHAFSICDKDYTDIVLANYAANIGVGTVVFYKDAARTQVVTNTGKLPLGLNIFYARVTSAKGCTNLAQLNITVLDNGPEICLTDKFCLGDVPKIVLANYNNRLQGTNVRWYSDVARTHLITELAIPNACELVAYARFINAAGCEQLAKLNITIHPRPHLKDCKVEFCHFDKCHFRCSDYNDRIGADKDCEIKWYRDKDCTKEVDLVENVEAGTYELYVEVTNKLKCKDRCKLTVCIHPVPIPKAITATYCDADQTDTILASFNGQLGDNITVQWFRDVLLKQPLTNTGNLSVGEHLFYAKVTNKLGCVCISKLTIRINANPVANDYEFSVCDKDYVSQALANFNIKIGSGTIAWFADAALKVPAVNTGDLGVGTFRFFAKLTNSAGCTDVGELKINVLKSPKLDCVPDLVVCKGEKVNLRKAVKDGRFYRDANLTDEITDCEVFRPAADIIVYVRRVNGICDARGQFRVVVINCCPKDSHHKEGDDADDKDDSNKGEETLQAASFTIENITAYAHPNPFKNHFNLNINSISNEKILVKVFNMLGALVELKVFDPKDAGNIHLGENYKTGIYNVVILQAGSIKYLKVIKE